MRSLSAIKVHAPLKALFLAGTKPRPTFTEEELAAAKREAYQRGSEEASRLIEGQMLEQRAEILHLQSETFAAVARQHAALVQQLRDVLPELAMEAVARILATTGIDREAVMRICRDLLCEIAPGREQVEVLLSPGDLGLIAGYEEGFRERHPEIVFRADPELKPGDCIIRSRFGVVDGRLATKLRIVEGFLK